MTSPELPAPIDESVLVALMSETLGTPVTSALPLAGAVGGQNLKLETADGTFTLKIAAHEVIAAEIWACRWARDHGVPAPEVVASDPAGHAVGRAWVLLGWQDGVPPGAGDPAVEEAGRHLASLHATSIQGYGRVLIAPGPDSARGEFDSWSEYVESILERGLELAGNRVLDPAVSKAARRAVRAAAHDTTYDGPGAVLHGDLHLRHLLAVGGRLTGILDWADASVGDPVMDLAVLSRDGEETLTTFARGYGLELSTATHRKVVAYRLLSTIDTLWFEWQTGGDWFDAYRGRIAADTATLRSFS